MAAIGCLLLIAGLCAETADAIYAGRSVNEWRMLMGRIDLRDPSSHRFVPGLIELIDDPTAPWITRRQAALTLGRLGPLAREAIPHVMAHLDEVGDDPETSPQRWALSSLALFGREAKAAAPKLAEMLANQRNSTVTRLGCLEALSQIGSAAPQSIRAIRQELERNLDQAVDEADEPLAIGAAEALGIVGPDAASAVPALMRAAQSDSAHLRREAIRALGRIAERAKDAQVLLLDAMLAEESALMRDAAMMALGQTGPSAWLLVSQLFASEVAEARERAATIAGGWKSEAAQIAPALVVLLSDHSPRVRLAAARSWRALTGRHERTWPVLVPLLADTDRDIRRGAAAELQAIVRSGSATSGEIDAVVEDPRPQVRFIGRRLQRIFERDR
jgi:HEAT repeat protein